MLRIHHSNRLERLLERLVETISRPLADPFAAECILVQNQGMARWLAQGIAERQGIAANLDFPLPARFIWDLLGLWFDDLPTQSEWDKDRLMWRILGGLPALTSDPGFAAPALYLETEPRALKSYQLARRVADLFDQYLVYRPDLVLAWEAAEAGPVGASDSLWQARLWRDLATAIHSPHRASLFRRLEEALAAGIPPRAPLPERVLVFGLSALPPVYGQLLGRLAHLVPVSLFVLSPSAAYWADLVDEPRIARARARELARDPAGSGAAPSTLWEVGNPLLASWGQGAMPLQDLLLDLGGDLGGDPIGDSGDEDQGDYEPPPDSSLLGLLQTDLLHLRDRRRTLPAERTMLDPSDQSLQVHVCHGPHREVQVLHDRLLRLFEELPDLEPRDILAMAPDIDRYAPHIESIFGAPGQGAPIPYAIADRRIEAEEPLLRAVADLLGLPTARLSAAQVLDWLGVPAIARRFRLQGEPQARVRRWVAETGVRWGLDGAMRADLGLPAEDANTWAFGLRRLFLGYALPPGDELYGQVLPYPHLEGQEAEALGGLQSFLDTLSHWRRELARPRSPAAWANAINRLLNDLLDPDEDESARLQPLREALDGLSAAAQAAGFDAPVDLDVLRAELADGLARTDPGRRFLTGRVTFCNMVPMRSIPTRVLCVLGLNGTDFPRDQRPAGFDLMAAAPRRGDRSRRTDDRHLFLETLLSARDRLHLSYQGHDSRDNGVRVPSVLVVELLDYCQTAFRDPDDQDPLARLCIHHPLQPFSRRYFDGSDPRLYSFSDDWCRAARAQPQPGADCFLPTQLQPPLVSPPQAEDQTLDIDDLIRFLKSPADWFLSRTLGLASPQESDVLEESEPFVPDRLADWQIKTRLLDLADRGRSSEAAAYLRGAGDLPHGVAGELVLDSAKAAVAVLRERIEPHRSDPRAALELDLEIRGWRLRGWLTGLTGSGLVRWRLGGARGSDLLDLWVHHLALCLAAPLDITPRSLLLTEEETLTLRPVADAEGHLADLIGLYLQGQSEPLPLFPKTSLAFARQGRGERIRAIWTGDRDRPGEGDRPAYRTAWRGREPLDSAFESLARQVFDPLLAALAQDEDEDGTHAGAQGETQ